jgi:hypothetical protein
MDMSESEQSSEPSSKRPRRFVQSKLSFAVRPTVDCPEALTNPDSSTGVSRQSTTSRHANQCQSVPPFSQLTCTDIGLAVGNRSLTDSEKLALLELQWTLQKVSSGHTASTIAKGNYGVNISGHNISVVNTHVSVTHWPSRVFFAFRACCLLENEQAAFS